MADVEAKVFTDGPVLVSGVSEITDQEGNVVATCDPSRPVAFCRCGMSSTKPMCDGTHAQGFDGTLNPPS